MNKAIALQIIAVFIASACFGQTSRAEKLERLKNEFPAHVAGKVTETSDPVIQMAYEDIRVMVMNLRVESLPRQLLELERKVALEIRAGGYADSDTRVGSSSYFYYGKKTSAQIHANRQNLAWLKQKVTPYLHRLSQFQRGKI